MRYPRTAESLAENPHAGRGPVLLDIGAESGGLVLHIGPDLLGAEVEILPGADHAHDHAHDHRHVHGHAHGHDHAPHDHAPHAEVLDRPLPDGSTQPCAVYPDLEPGWYTLRLLPHGPSMNAFVRAATVTTVTWSPSRDG